MAQIFKTISLEDRLRASIYNQLPQKPQSVSQGEGAIKLPTTPTFSDSAQLKITIDARDKNAAILKDIARSTGAQILPNINLSEPTGLTRFNIPQANTKFRTTISLADRLAQTGLGTTVHLPQFFLADFYANYITISPFGIFNHTSTIIIPQSGPTPNQGGLLPINITFAPNHTSNIQPPIPIADYILLQGGIFSNGIYTSIAPITFTPEDFILRQGVVLVGVNYRSLITISLPTQDVILRQGAVIVNGLFESLIDPSDPTPVGFVLQGYGVTPTQAISIQAVYPLQGVIVSLNTLQSGIIPATPIATPDQGGLDPTPITFEPDRSSPILRVLFYAAQRALAFFSPRIVHGSADLRNENFAERNLYYGSTIDVDGLLRSPDARRFISVDLLRYARQLSVRFGDSNALLVGRVATLDYSYDTVGETIDIQTSTGGIYPNYRSEKFETNTAGIVLNTSIEEKSITNLQNEVINIHNTFDYDANRLPGTSFPIPKGAASALVAEPFRAYRTLAYDQMAERAENGSSRTRSDFRSLLNQPQNAHDIQADFVVGGDGNLVGEFGINSEGSVNYKNLGADNYGTGFNAAAEVRDGKSPPTAFRGSNSGIFQTLGYKEILVRANNGKQNILQSDFRTFRNTDVTVPVNGAGRRPLDPLGIDEDDKVAYQLLGQQSYGGGRTYTELYTGEDPNGAYKTLGYEEIVDRIESGTTEDFRLTTGRGINGTNNGQGRSVNNRSGFFNGKVSGDTGASDLINLIVGGIRFRAFLTSFNDGYTINWNDINYVGRQDTLKAFKGVTRGGSVGFKIAAFNQKDLNRQYAKLNSLVSAVAIGKPTASVAYITGPLTTLTVGNWLVGTPVVMGSLKFDVQTAEYSWETAYGKQLPHIVDVSMDFTVLGDVAGSVLPGASYFGGPS